MDLVAPVRLSLARLPTPLEPLERTSQRLGHPLWIKRDDLTGLALTGNKVRKLEYLVAEAVELGATRLVTCGAVTSNHARATAVAAARVGLAATLVLRGNPATAVTGNLLLDRIFGADVIFIPPSEWKNRAVHMQAAADAHQATTAEPAYVIPEGGSSEVGAMGYAVAAGELIEQERELGLKIGRVVHAVGSGGTTAGLALGFAACGRPEVEVIGIAVCNDAAWFDLHIRQTLAACVERGYVEPEVAERARWRVVEGYTGLGYAKVHPREQDVQHGFARETGILLDPVYSGKAWCGLEAEVARSRLGGEGDTVFLHTGGSFGLFHFAEQAVPDSGVGAS